MIKTKNWAGLLFGCWISLPFSLLAKADGHNTNVSEEDSPDQELLEFIANFGGTDDETFDLIIYHGKDDLENTDETSTTQEPDHDK